MHGIYTAFVVIRAVTPCALSENKEAFAWQTVLPHLILLPNTTDYKRG